MLKKFLLISFFISLVLSLDIKDECKEIQDYFDKNNIILEDKDIMYADADVDNDEDEDVGMVEDNNKSSGFICQTNNKGQVIDISIYLPEDIKDKHLKKAFSYNTIEKLEIKNSDMDKIPSSIYNIKSLKKLYIRMGKVTELSENIGNLKNLTELHLKYNYIKAIPDRINELSKLEILNLENNKINKIPNNLNLVNLKELNLYGNEIEEIPKSIGNMKGLISLELGGNMLSEVPDELKNLVNLKTFSLAHNEFKKFPSIIKYFKNLEELNLCFNNIDDELPQYLNDFQNLKRLVIQGNKNIKGIMLTNESVDECRVNDNYDLCIVKETPCLQFIANFNYCEVSSIKQSVVLNKTKKTVKKTLTVKKN